MRNHAIMRKRPETLQELYRKCALVIWGGKPSERVNCANLEEIITILENPKLSEINTQMLDELAGILSVGRVSATVNNKLSTLSTILRYAYARDWIAKMPVFPWKEHSRTRLRWLRDDEETQLMERLPDDVRAFCEILVDTGMRRGELMDLTAANIEGDFIHLWPNQTKTKRERFIPLSPRAKLLVTKWVPFNTISKSKLRHHWVKAKEAMGLSKDKDFVLHSLRHTAATRMLATTNNIVLVKELLGHSKVQTTLKYAHVNSQQLLEAVNKVHAVFGSQPKQDVEPKAT